MAKTNKIVHTPDAGLNPNPNTTPTPVRADEKSLFLHAYQYPDANPAPTPLPRCASAQISAERKPLLRIYVHTSTPERTLTLPLTRCIFAQISAGAAGERQLRGLHGQAPHVGERQHGRVPVHAVRRLPPVAGGTHLQGAVGAARRLDQGAGETAGRRPEP